MHKITKLFILTALSSLAIQGIEAVHYHGYNQGYQTYPSNYHTAYPQYGYAQPQGYQSDVYIEEAAAPESYPLPQYTFGQSPINQGYGPAYQTNGYQQQNRHQPQAWNQQGFVSSQNPNLNQGYGQAYQTTDSQQGWNQQQAWNQPGWRQQQQQQNPYAQAQYPGMNPQTSASQGAFYQSGYAQQTQTQGTNQQNQAQQGTVIEVLMSNPSFSTLAQAIRNSGLAQDLAQRDEVTIFAPTNQAFQKLSPNQVQDLLRPENKQKLADLLKNHIIDDTYNASDLTNNTDIETLGGNELKVQAQGQRVKINNANVIGADIKASNGVIHVVDTLIFPAQDD